MSETAKRLLVVDDEPEFAKFVKRTAEGIGYVVTAISESYARKLVTAISGGVFDLLDAVFEFHSLDDLGELA